jgi:ferredoxin
MIQQAGLSYNGFETISFKEYSAGDILQKIKEISGIEDGKADFTLLKSDLDVPAWFPVIDKSLCTLCGKCARFCLFGVYNFNGKRLEVINPLACKNNCPACGRTCPASAIMFPRMAEKTPLSGAEPGSTPNVGGDLLIMLNERNRNRKGIFRNNIMKQAEDERRKALEELKHAVNKKK